MISNVGNRGHAHQFSQPGQITFSNNHAVFNRVDIWEGFNQWAVTDKSLTWIDSLYLLYDYGKNPLWIGLLMLLFTQSVEFKPLGLVGGEVPTDLVNKYQRTNAHGFLL